MLFDLARTSGLLSVLLVLAGASEEACEARTSDVQSLLQSSQSLERATRTSSRSSQLVNRLLAEIGERSGQTPELDVLFHDLDQLLRNKGQKVWEGHTTASGSLALQTAQYDTWARSPSSRTICETGFNAGHSALRFLAQSRARLVEFDIGQHPYAKLAAKFLQDRFPGRLLNVWGDSRVTLPRYHQDHPDMMCDIIVVDGGHSYDVAMSDLKSFAKMAAPGSILTIDDTPCISSWCEGPTKAWQELVELGCIEQSREVPMGSDRGFTVGRYTPCAHLA